MRRIRACRARSAQGYAAPSKAALARYAQQMYSSFAEARRKLYRGQRLEETGSGADAKAMAGALEKLSGMRLGRK